MTIRSIFCAAMLLYATSGIAQQDAEQLEAAETRLINAEEELLMAEERLAAAAMRVAEMSMQRLPEMRGMQQYIRAGGRGPVLGITISGTDANKNGPVEGVEIRGVSPGGAADEAGLRTGDIITAINNESLTAESDDAANRLLLDFMDGVESGDVLKVEYLRNGQSSQLELAPRELEHEFAFDFNFDEDLVLDALDAYPGMAADIYSASRFGRMELADISENLGRYFGTSEGLLVVHAPEEAALQLQDGDVILSIDGRTPNNISHAMRIFHSYQSGEQIRMEVMRDKSKRVLEFQIPERG